MEYSTTNTKLANGTNPIWLASCSGVGRCHGQDGRYAWAPGSEDDSVMKLVESWDGSSHQFFEVGIDPGC